MAGVGAVQNGVKCVVMHCACILWAARRRVAGKARPLGDRVLGGLLGGIETLSFTALIASAILNSARSPAC